MRTPLGKLLLTQRLVTPEQLERALRAQQQWGARIGSNLVRMGALDFDTLARALSLHYGVPAAFDQDFEHAQPTALLRLPRHLVEKHLAVPLALEYGQVNRTLKIALPNPDAVAVIDELAFAAGMRVQVQVAAELRILRFLEAHYSGLDPGQLPPPLSLPLDVPPPVALPPTVPWLSESLEDEDPLASGFSWRSLIAQLPVSTGASAHEPHAPPLLLEHEVSEPELATAPLPETPLSAAHAVGLLAQVQLRDQVGDLLLRSLKGRFRHGLVLVVGAGHARAWRAFGPALGAELKAELTVPLNRPSCLRAAYERRAPYRGPLPRDGGQVHAALWRAFGCEPPKEVLVMPLLLGPRVAALLYGHGTESGNLPDAWVDELGRISAAAATALVRLGSPV